MHGKGYIPDNLCSCCTGLVDHLPGIEPEEYADIYCKKCGGTGIIPKSEQKLSLRERILKSRGARDEG